jgi:mRNA-degrading endonuclease toxin of MazEF toxin-antitoxin module
VFKKPQRGEIWRVRLGLQRRKTEPGVGKFPMERPCLIVSSNDFNEGADRLTIVPTTKHTDAKEDMISLCGVTIRVPDDINIDPTNELYPEEEKLRVEKIGYQGHTTPYKVIIDCSQLYTIFAFDPAMRPELDADLCDLRLNRRYGILAQNAMIRIDAALQVVVGGGIHYHQEALPFKEGDILELNLPIGDRVRCLVVSSSAVDTIRKHRGLKQCTVVPLVPIQYYDASYPPGVAIVEIYPHDNQQDPASALAICQEIYTIDWQSRNVISIGRASDRDIENVREALREYLDIP